MDFLKNPYVKGSIIAILLIIIFYDLFLFVKESKSPPPPPPSEFEMPPVRTTKEEGKPLYELAKELRDPFRGDESKIWKLQEAIKIEQMELELLRAQLEKKKIKEELYSSGTKGSRKAVGKPKVKAILWTDRGKTAIIEYGGEEFSVAEGDLIDGYEVTRIERKGVYMKSHGRENFYPVHPNY
jgi:hypothetical protein